MKAELVLLVILSVFKSATTEFRHHQDRYSRENITTFPWYSMTQQKLNEGEKAVEIASIRKQSIINLPKENRKRNVHEFTNSPSNLRYTDILNGGNSTGEKFASSSSQLLPTQPVLSVGNLTSLVAVFGNRQKKLFSNEKNLEKVEKLANEPMEVKNSTKTFGAENSNLQFSKAPCSVRRNHGDGIATVCNESFSPDNISSKEISTKNQTLYEKVNFDSQKFPRNSISFQTGQNGEKYKNLNFFRDISKFHFAQPLITILTEPDEPESCVENVLENFSVSHELVTQDVLTDKNVAEKLTAILTESRVGLDEVTEVMKSTMEKHPRITSISINTLKKMENSKMEQTIYRKGNDLLIHRQSYSFPKFPNDQKTFWTPLFQNCLTGSWTFGYSFISDDKNYRIDTTVYFDIEGIKGTIDQCKPYFRQVLNGGPKCDSITTKCVPILESGFSIGGYNCVCREGFYYPEEYQSTKYYSGVEIEKTFENGNMSSLRCLPCPEFCSASCTSSGLCVFQRNSLLRNCILLIQIFCVLTASTLTILVFKHRKCKTIATGMWTIMEMILLGSIILYATVIIRAFSPSTILCLIEPWCREIGFVLCYGAIILKLYRILIEFRTRKAHRWIVRDKDLLKYLLGMVIIVTGYMSAWTAMNLDLIKKENYSMLTTITTAEKVHFNACKAVWWDYVTEAGEILILIFGIHLSYASRNATTQFQERCFLCISISVEAVVSSVFYILRYFFWETTMHPDFSFVANFTRCQLTTTVVLLLLLTPKWWYQKVQINKARVSRNYLMQESSRGPFEAFKPQDGITATNSDVEGEITLADMNPEDIKAELKRLYTQLEVLKNKTIRFDNPHISKRRGGRKIAHRRFSLQKRGSKEKALRQQTQRLSSKHTDVEVTEAEPSRTPEDSVCSNEGPSIIINDGPSDIVHMTPKKNQK